MTRGVMYVSLHTADPTGGDASKFEASYGNYARMTIAHDSREWEVVKPADDLSGGFSRTIDFPRCTGGSDNITHAAVGDGHKLTLVVKLDEPIEVMHGVTPKVLLKTPRTELKM